jgi:hypothetical protein
MYLLPFLLSSHTELLTASGLLYMHFVLPGMFLPSLAWLAPAYLFGLIFIREEAFPDGINIM